MRLSMSHNLTKRNHLDSQTLRPHYLHSLNSQQQALGIYFVTL